MVALDRKSARNGDATAERSCGCVVAKGVMAVEGRESLGDVRANDEVSLAKMVVRVAGGRVAAAGGGVETGTGSCCSRRSALCSALVARFAGICGIAVYARASSGSSAATVLDAAKRSVGVEMEMEIGRKGLRRGAWGGVVLRARDFSVTTVFGGLCGDTGCGEEGGAWVDVLVMAATIRAPGGRIDAHS